MWIHCIILNLTSFFRGAVSAAQQSEGSQHCHTSQGTGLAMKSAFKVWGVQTSKIQQFMP